MRSLVHPMLSKMRFGAVGVAIWVGAPTAFAGLTDVRAAAAGEATHEQILEQVYGADFAASGTDFTAGGMTVRRVDDGADGRFRLDAPRRLDLVAAFTGWQWDFSLKNSSGGRVGSASQSGSGFDASGGFDVAAGDSFEMVLDHSSGRQYRSTDALDQLVTYEVLGADGGEERLFFWEDWSRRKGSDQDFNDLVLRAWSGDLAGGGAAAVGDDGSAAAVSIPLPPAAWPGAAGLIGVGMVAVRRFRRR